MNVGIQLGDPVAGHQEGGQVKEIYKHFVAVATGEEKEENKNPIIVKHDPFNEKAHWGQEN